MSQTWEGEAERKKCMNVRQTLNRVFILGNGFDVDLGYKTKYSDFAKSNEWKQLMKPIVGNHGHSLLKFMKTKEYTEEWFDIEASLLEYARKASSNNVQYNIAEDENDYIKLCNALGKYMKNLKFSEFNKDSCAAQFARLLDSTMDIPIVFSFNFTPLEQNIEYIINNHVATFNYMHGTLNDSDYILGFECENFDSIRKEYSFMFKSNNSNYKPGDMSENMLHAREVVIFGHSLNPIDFIYFKPYFLYIMQTDEEGEDKRILTIFTYNDYSERIIKDNIRSMGISIPELSMHVKLKFLKTYNIEKGVEADAMRFQEFINQ